METTSVWIDCDLAIGLRESDVDDGLALIQAFHSPELSIRGVSSVFGNTTLDRALPLTHEIVERFGPPDLGVFGGAASRDELGRETEAVRALAEALSEAPLHLLALGPLTNVGSLLRLHPELAAGIESIVMVAARRPGQRFVSAERQPTPFPDFNFECDPAAMRVVLESDRELVFAPWEVSSHVWLTGEDLDALAATSESGAYIAERSRHWLGIWQDEMNAPGFNPFDTLAVGWVTHPALMRRFEGACAIEQGPHDGVGRGDARLPQGDTKPYLVVREDERGRRATYCHEPEAGFKPILLDRLAGGALRRPTGSGDAPGPRVLA